MRRFAFLNKVVATAIKELLGYRLMVGLRFLVPPIEVRVLVPQQRSETYRVS